MNPFLAMGSMNTPPSWAARRRASIVRSAGLAALGVALATTFAPSTAEAQEPDKIATGRKLADDGASFYHAREYRKALEKFQAAYAVDPDPNLLYNIAKCHEALGENPQAIEKYEHFLREPGSDPGGKLKAEESLKVLRQARDTSATPSAEPPSSGATATPEAKQRYVVPTLVALGVGVVGVGVGSIFGAMALGTQADLDASCPNKSCPPRSRDDVDTLSTQSTVSTVGFIAGGVGLAAGAVLYILGRPSTEKARTGLRVSPALSAAVGGVAGTF